MIALCALKIANASVEYICGRLPVVHCSHQHSVSRTNRTDLDLLKLDLRVRRALIIKPPANTMHVTDFAQATIVCDCVYVRRILSAITDDTYAHGDLDMKKADAADSLRTSAYRKKT